MSDDSILNKIMTKSTCETYVPKSLAIVGGATGAVEGFAFGGVLGSIPSAAFQAVGGHTIGQSICNSMKADAVEPPAPTPNPLPGTSFLAKR